MTNSSPRVDDRRARSVVIALSRASACVWLVQACTMDLPSDGMQQHAAAAGVEFTCEQSRDTGFPHAACLRCAADDQHDLSGPFSCAWHLTRSQATNAGTRHAGGLVIKLIAVELNRINTEGTVPTRRLLQVGGRLPPLCPAEAVGSAPPFTQTGCKLARCRRSAQGPCRGVGQFENWTSGHRGSNNRPSAPRFNAIPSRCGLRLSSTPAAFRRMSPPFSCASPATAPARSCR
jgi:hypothetical protein